MKEVDTCREFVRPKLEAAGWDESPHSYKEQESFTDGRIVVIGGEPTRRPKKRADFLLRYTRDVTLAVVEAKRTHKTVGTGLQQAKEYAEILEAGKRDRYDIDKVGSFRLWFGDATYSAGRS